MNNNKKAQLNLKKKKPVLHFAISQRFSKSKRFPKKKKKILQDTAGLDGVLLVQCPNVKTMRPAISKDHISYILYSSMCLKKNISFFCT